MGFDRQQLETFAAVIETRHFGKAAGVLNVTRGAVSQRIIALEEAFGTPLLIRDGISPTPAGEALLGHIQALKLLEANTLKRIKPSSNERVKIAIAVNADSLATWFEPIACDIAKQEFALELIVDDQDFTLSALTRGEAIGCISTESQSPTGFVADAIGGMEYECVATSAFAEEHFSQGINVHSVLAAPAVLFNRKDGIHATFLEQLLGFSISGYAAHYFPSPLALLRAIYSGVGYGLIPSMQAQPLIETGGVIALAPRNNVFVNLYWHHWESAPESARAISEMIVGEARRVLIRPSGMFLDRPDESWTKIRG